MGMVGGRARRRTALVVGGAAYAAGRSRSGGEQYQGEEYEQPPPVPVTEAPPAPAEPSPTFDYDELEQLGKLHAAGTLTDEEFAAAKAKILGA
jgi:Short C-terminal domain